ncbi:non-ribosomal peptide synthetase [Nocardioides sp. NPDC057772]|uniref:non-ribosomal peptide synthetase n=1 Tax=Nocardioides sp. NPDC057772 TaxID=3346245 RepID=UPI00366D1E28
MNTYQTTFRAAVWDGAGARGAREVLTRVATRYRPDGVVEIDDAEGSWTCIHDDGYREQSRSAVSGVQVDVELVTDGVVRSPAAAMSIERTGDLVTFTGRGPMAGAEEVRGFAALVAQLLGEEGAAEQAGAIARDELAVGMGPVELGPESGVWTAVLRHALMSPTKCAIEEGVRSTNYEELARLAVANAQLIAGHARPREPVAVGLGRGTQSAVAQLAAFLADCPVVLIDPVLPPMRVEEQLRQSGAVAVVGSNSTDSVRHSAAAAGLRFIDVDMDIGDSTIDLNVEIKVSPPLDPDATSHIAFTSGSTGTPKAVELRHGPMANTAVAIAAASGLAPDSRASWFCPPGVGLVQVDLFPSLWTGATVVVAPDSLGSDPRTAWKWIEDQAISHAQMPTAFAEQMIKLDSGVPESFRSLRVAGERLGVWPTLSCTYQVLNVYGSTEANVVSLCDATRLMHDVPRERLSAVPIGRPVRNVNMYVLDSDLNPVPRRVIGELCVSGRSLSRGYLNDEARAATKFVANPIDSDPFPVLYRSGDLARFGADGVVEVVGRIDDEVKIDGVRVLPAEIEHELLSLDVIATAAVVAHEPSNGSRVLVAYIDGDSEIDVDVVRTFLENRLPAPSVPRRYVVGAVPTGRNGKIDRLTLSQRPLDRPELSAPFSVPEGEREKQFCGIFADVLGLASVGADDDFFELGGGSLQAAMLIERAESDFGLEMDFLTLVDRPTPRRLAAAS